MSLYLHTADWQIGKPYKNITDIQKRFRLQQARLDAISNISKLARSKEIEAVFVAGDLFDSSTVSSEQVMEALSLIGAIDKPTLVIPGNHDHGGAGGIWSREDVKAQLIKRAPNMKLLTERKPVILDSVVVLPCPLMRRHESSDPTSWIRDIKWSGLPEGKPRVVLAHGSINTFEAKDYDNFSYQSKTELNILELEKLPKKQIDYIALGDWHNCKEVQDNAWYSGTPEPDRFDAGENEERGQVLIIDLDRGKQTKVKKIKTSSLYWHNLSYTLRSSNDIHKMERDIKDITSNRVCRDLIRMEVNGYLGLEDYEIFNSIIMDLKIQLIELRIKGFCHKAPKEDELLSVTKRNDDPLIRNVSKRILQEIKNKEIKNDCSTEEINDQKISEVALCELHRLCSENETNNNK